MTVALILIALMISDIEHLHLCLLAICIKVLCSQGAEEPCHGSVMSMAAARSLRHSLGEAASLP